MAEASKTNIRLIPKLAQEQIRGALASMDTEEDATIEKDLTGQTDSPSINIEPQMNGEFAILLVDRIRFSPLQVRDNFKQEALEELASSVKTKGVLQPVLVRPTKTLEGGETVYEIVAGERRLRAARLAGLEEIPAIIQELDDQETLELAIIENAQRENLNPIEAANAYKKLANNFKLSQQEIAKRIGKSRSSISNAVRLLQLEPEVIELIQSEDLSVGHAKLLLGIKDPELQVQLASKICIEQMSVRSLEREITKLEDPIEYIEESEEESAEQIKLERLENKLRKYLDIEDTRLSLNSNGKKRLSITFPSEASWKRFMSKLK